MTNRLLSGLACVGLLAAGQAAFAADPANGRQIYSMHCVVCHGVDGHAVMPNVPSFASGDRLMQPDMAIANTIRSGKAVMPAFLGILREQEIRDVIAYLRTLNR